jgi:hypothetical protein
MKLSTGLRAGECPTGWAYGQVQEASGGGYYGSVKGQDGLTHYFNTGYTEFYPSGQGVGLGQVVLYAPFVPPNERAGKVACIMPAAPYPTPY